MEDEFQEASEIEPDVIDENDYEPYEYTEEIVEEDDTHGEEATRS